jgi:hypothetical protein
MSDANKQKRIVVTFSSGTNIIDIVYTYLKKYVSNTDLVSKVILPQTKFKALLLSSANEQDIKEAAIEALNFSRQSMIDVLDTLALRDIQLPPEVLQRFQNSLHNIVPSNMSAPSVATTTSQQPIASPVDQLKIQEETHITADLDNELNSEIQEIDSPLFR